MLIEPKRFGPGYKPEPANKCLTSKNSKICKNKDVYDENSKLIELHHKYPEDKGHQKV